MNNEKRGSLCGDDSEVHGDATFRARRDPTHPSDGIDQCLDLLMTVQLPKVIRQGKLLSNSSSIKIIVFDCA